MPANVVSREREHAGERVTRDFADHTALPPDRHVSTNCE